MKATVQKQTNAPILTAMLGKTVVLSGKFDRGELDYLSDLTEAQQGTIQKEVDPKVDLLVLADVAAGKTVQRKATSLNAKGAAIQTIDKTAYLQLIQPTNDQLLALIRGGSKNAEVLLKVVGSQRFRYYVIFSKRNHPAPSITFSSEVFDGLDLSDLRLEHFEFRQCSFVGSILNGTIFGSATECDFSRAKITSAAFSDVHLSRFISAHLDQVEFHGNIDGADFSQAHFGKCGFTQPQHGTRSSGKGVFFPEASIKSTCFRSATLQSSDFSKAELPGSTFHACELQNSIFNQSRLCNTSMVESKLNRATFTDADLTGTDFSGSDLTGAVMDGADLKGAIFAGAKLDQVDFSKAKNYSPLPKSTAGTGPSLAELDNLAQQARRIHLEFQVEKGSEREKVGVDSARLKWGWGLILNQPHHMRRQSITTMSAALQFLATRVGQSKVCYETLDVKSTKSPKTGKALRDLVMNAIAEAFNQPIPPAAELAAAVKAYREQTAESKSVDRERLKKAKELAEKQKQTAKRQIAKKIEKEVGRVTDIATFLKALELRADKSKIDKATRMLKAEKFQLFNDITDTHLNGVVKSQTDADLVYACRIESDGHYACCTQNLNICGGLRGSICKHLLVLIVGLVKAGQLDPSSIDAWIARTHDVKPELNKETMGEIFIRYKGAEAGEVDWRPTETVPEDYYAV